MGEQRHRLLVQAAVRAVFRRQQLQILVAGELAEHGVSVVEHPEVTDALGVEVEGLRRLLAIEDVLGGNGQRRAATEQPDGLDLGGEQRRLPVGGDDPLQDRRSPEASRRIPCTRSVRCLARDSCCR